ncbi:hypothetical protein DV515_00007287 [Chloebia gouldiae]|uniref:Uncharacterized protein n=1 Tax=Chloebia gouldiae TaxID=44316 RepID=A0A3L8SI81_CHLGU|nr:hypothetical protein DV515_00007287 [Chloebia gouldiae]
MEGCPTPGIMTYAGRSGNGEPQLSGWAGSSPTGLEILLSAGEELGPAAVGKRGENAPRRSRSKTLTSPIASWI